MVNMCFSSGFSDAPMVCPKPVKPGPQFLHRLPILAGQIDFQVGLTAFPQAPPGEIETAHHPCLATGRGVRYILP